MADEQVEVIVEEGDVVTIEEKKGGWFKKFVLFAFIAAATAAVVRFLKGRRAGMDENEWQELPPPATG